MISPKQAEAHLARVFAEAGDPESATSQKAYMKSDLRFHGVDSETVRRTARELLSEHPDLDHDALVAIAKKLLASPWFDLRSTAIALLERKKRELVPADLEWLETAVRQTHCWAHVDWIATKLVGPILRGAPAQLRRLAAWAKDEDFWVRRTALLAQLDELKAGRGDLALFLRIAAPMLPEKDFFIRKAIGWVLRDVSKRRPEEVYAFLAEHRERASGLTLREGAKHLSSSMRRSLGLPPAARAA